MPAVEVLTPAQVFCERRDGALAASVLIMDHVQQPVLRLLEASEL